MPRIEEFDRWLGSEKDRFLFITTGLAAFSLFAVVSFKVLEPGLASRSGVDPMILQRFFFLGTGAVVWWTVLALAGRSLWETGAVVREILIWSVLLSVVGIALVAIQWSGSVFTFLLLFIPAGVSVAAACFGLRRAFFVWLLFSAGHAALVVLEMLGILPIAPLFPDISGTILGDPWSHFAGVFGTLSINTFFLLASAWTVDAMDRARRRTEGTLSALRATNRELIVAESGATVGKVVESAVSDLNRPLGSAQSLVGSVLSDLANPGDVDREDLKETLSRVQSALATASDRLSQLAAIGSQHVKHLEPVDLSRIARDMGEQATSSAAGFEVSLELDLDPVLPPVWANRRQVTDAAAALCVAALEAMDGKPGRLRIETRLRGKEAALSVVGPTFPSGLGSEEPSRQEGLGKARAILSLYGGRIEIHEERSGGRAEIVLPLHPHSAPPA